MLVSAVQQCESAMYVQSCPTLYDPIDGSPPESSSMGFSRQEYWSGLPFPSPETSMEVLQKIKNMYVSIQSSDLSAPPTLYTP